MPKGRMRHRTAKAKQTTRPTDASHSATGKDSERLEDGPQRQSHQRHLSSSPAPAKAAREVAEGRGPLPQRPETRSSVVAAVRSWPACASARSTTAPSSARCTRRARRVRGSKDALPLPPRLVQRRKRRAAGAAASVSAPGRVFFRRAPPATLLSGHVLRPSPPATALPPDTVTAAPQRARTLELRAGHGAGGREGARWQTAAATGAPQHPLAVAAAHNGRRRRPALAIFDAGGHGRRREGRSERCGNQASERATSVAVRGGRWRRGRGDGDGGWIRSSATYASGTIRCARGQPLPPHAPPASRAAFALCRRPDDLSFAPASRPCGAAVESAAQVASGPKHTVTTPRRRLCLAGRSGEWPGRVGADERTEAHSHLSSLASSTATSRRPTPALPASARAMPTVLAQPRLSGHAAEPEWSWACEAAPTLEADQRQAQVQPHRRQQPPVRKIPVSYDWLHRKQMTVTPVDGGDICWSCQRQRVGPRRCRESLHTPRVLEQRHQQRRVSNCCSANSRPYPLKQDRASPLRRAALPAPRPIPLIPVR